MPLHTEAPHMHVTRHAPSPWQGCRCRRTPHDRWCAMRLPARRLRIQSDPDAPKFPTQLARRGSGEPAPASPDIYKETRPAFPCRHQFSLPTDSTAPAARSGPCDQRPVADACPGALPPLRRASAAGRRAGRTSWPSGGRLGCSATARATSAASCCASAACARRSARASARPPSSAPAASATAAPTSAAPATAAATCWGRARVGRRGRLQ